MSFTSVLDALTPAVGVGETGVEVRLGGKTVRLRPVPATAALALRRVDAKPAVPLRHSGGSLSPRVPVDRDDPAYAEYTGRLDAWFLNYRAATLVCAAAAAEGALTSPFTDGDAKAALDAGKTLAARLTMDAIDAAYTALERAGDDLSPSALALAQADLIAPVEAGAGGAAKASAELVRAREKGGDGVTLPYALPPEYSYTPAYFVHYACTLYGCTPDQFVAVDPATRVSMVAFARLVHAERARDSAAAAGAGMRP